jgi:hypothetical protein
MKKYDVVGAGLPMGSGMEESEEGKYCLASDVSVLERDAARYRWLKQANPSIVCSIAWSVGEACQFNVVDEAVDAAMAAKPSPSE